MVEVWAEFKAFNVKSAKLSLKHVPRDFDKIFGYLDTLMFVDKNVDFDQKYSARAWLIELWLHAQQNSK